MNEEDFDVSTLSQEERDALIKQAEEIESTLTPQITTESGTVLDVPAETVEPTTETVETDKDVMWEEMRLWRGLPKGIERDELENAWRLKYYGTTDKPSGFIYGSNKPGVSLAEDVGAYATQLRERLSGPGQGVIDFFTSDLPSIIPGVNIPKAPKYDDGFAQGVRDISSFILPTILIGNTASAKLKALSITGKGGPVINWLGKTNLRRKTASFGLGWGTDLFVEGTNSLNQEGLNALGSLKDMFPKTFQFLPYSVATHPTDSPDVKRNKAVMEATYFYFGAGLIEGGLKILRAGNDLKKLGTEIIPKDSTAKEYFDIRYKKGDVEFEPSNNPISDAVQKTEVANKTAIEELAELTVRTGEDLDKPIRGIHDVFDLGEQVVRTPDQDGIAGAMVRQAQIERNLATSNGRLGSFITEAALKYGVQADNLSKRLLVKSVIEDIKSTGKFDAVVNGRVITNAQIDEAGTKLAEIFIDPRADTGVISGVLKDFKDTATELGVKRLTATGYDGAFKAIKALLKEYFDMDVAKAQAYLATSLAGDVSDMSEGIRISGNAPSVKYARSMIRDRLKYLMAEKALAAWTYGTGLAQLNVWERIASLNPEEALDYAKLINERQATANGKSIAAIEDTLNKFDELTEKNPDFFKPLYLAYEFSDGNIDTIHKLNTFMQNKLGTWEKLVIDRTPEIPSVVNRAMWSNIYNSTLSAFATPLKALIGNIGGTVGNPIAMFTGALLEGDSVTRQRGLIAYRSITDASAAANKHLGMVYRKASTDPMSVGYIMRDELALKNEQAFDIMREYADAASKKGHDGAAYLLNMYEVHEDIARHPWLRFGANSMTAMDGWTRAFEGSIEARFRAFDQLNASGKVINEQSLKEASEQIYKEMQDSAGMIIDPAVDYKAREIALNLDGPLVQRLNDILASVPAIKTAVMFQKTAGNIIGTMHKWGPTSIIAGDYAKIARPKLTVFQNNEELVKEILQSKGIPIDESPVINWFKFRQLRATVKGKVAIGSLLVTSAGFYMGTDRLRGNGHYDKATMRTRYGSGWKPRTFKGLDGKWYSYDNMGPLTDWLALTADIFDHFDLITTPIQEEWLNKMMFVLAANLTNKSVLGQLEPFFEMFSNPAGLNRWAAAFSNNLLPLGSQRNELARLMQPALKELDQDFNQLLANRNILVKNTLPDQYNWLTGEKIGYPDNMLVRFWNTYSPVFKMHGKSPDAVEQFLIDLEYDGRPGFRTDGKGYEYTASERSELQSLIGQEGRLRKEIQSIKRRADNNQVIEKLRKIRRAGYTSKQVDKDEFFNIVRLLDRALLKAVKRNERKLSNYAEIQKKKAELRLLELKAKKGQLPINELPILPNR